MPTKRDLIGTSAPFDGLHWAEFQWSRIFAFFSGLSLIILYFWMNPFQHLPEWTTTSLASIPVGLIIYGVTEQSWRTAMRISVGVGIGSGLAIYLNSAGVHLYREILLLDLTGYPEDMNFVSEKAKPNSAIDAIDD